MVVEEEAVAVVVIPETWELVERGWSCVRKEIVFIQMVRASLWMRLDVGILGLLVLVQA